MKIIRLSEIPKEVQHRPLFIGEVAVQALITQEMGETFLSSLRNWAPGARAKFHTHSSDQLLIITEGRGMITSEKETAAVGIGEIVFIPVGEKHWHGATKDSSFAYIDIRARDSITTQIED